MRFSFYTIFLCCLVCNLSKASALKLNASSLPFKDITEIYPASQLISPCDDCSDTLVLMNGKRMVVRYGRSNKKRVLYQNCNMNGSVHLSFPKRDVRKVILADGTVKEFNRGSKKEYKREKSAHVWTVFGIVLGSIALIFGTLVILIAVYS